MPKYYCDYCDVFLTHDSASVRKAHNAGRNHLNNVKDYYASLGHDKAQKWIDELTRAIEKGLPPPQPPPGVLGINTPSGQAPAQAPAPMPMPMGFPGMPPPGMPMPPPGLPMPPPGMPLPPPGLNFPPGFPMPPNMPGMPPMPSFNGVGPPPPSLPSMPPPMPGMNGSATPMDGVIQQNGSTSQAQPVQQQPKAQPIPSSTITLKPGQVLLYGDNDTSPEEKRSTLPQYKVKNDMAEPEMTADGPAGAKRASAAQFM